MKKIMKKTETIFCITYLLFALVSGILFIKNSTSEVVYLYGIMTLILCFGDAFHLIPRIIKNIKGESKKIEWWMNFGLIITSITMTVFYVLLFYIWKILYNENPTIIISTMPWTPSIIITLSIWALAIARIILCLLPQNKWFLGGNKKMSFYRNLVFSMIGIIEIILFLILGGSYGTTMAICILLSFLFYLPVALFGKDNKKLGMLMIPKTIMYIIMISLGFSL